MWDGVDRRRFPRAEYPCLITVRKNTPPVQAVLTHTENISVTGVRVIITKKIEVMTEVDLEIDLKDTLKNVISKGTIAWVKEVAQERKGKPPGKGTNINVLKGVVAWVKEIPPTQKGKPPRYDTGIQFTVLKAEDRRRIENIVNHLLGK